MSIGGLTMASKKNDEMENAKNTEVTNAEEVKDELTIDLTNGDMKYEDNVYEVPESINPEEMDWYGHHIRRADPDTGDETIVSWTRVSKDHPVNAYFLKNDDVDDINRALKYYNDEHNPEYMKAKEAVGTFAAIGLVAVASAGVYAGYKIGKKIFSKLHPSDEDLIKQYEKLQHKLEKRGIKVDDFNDEKK